MPARYPGDRPEASGQAGPRAPPQGHDQPLKEACRNNVDMPSAVINVEKVCALTILSPRAAVAVGMIRGAMGMTAGLR